MNLLQLFCIISFHFSDGLRGFVGDNDNLVESATLYRLADLPSIAFDLGKGGDNEAFRYFCKIEKRRKYISSSVLDLFPFYLRQIRQVLERLELLWCWWFSPCQISLSSAVNYITAL